MSRQMRTEFEEGSTHGDAVRSYLIEVRQYLDRAFGMELGAILGKVGNGRALVEDLNEGKKIRGCLTCLVGESLGASRELVIPRAVAIELIQAATLIHDDYVDGDTMRRGRPAAWAVVGGRRAVLVGDVMFASAIAKMCGLSREDGAAAADAIALISRGALYEPLEAGDLDLFAKNGEPDRALYDKIIFLKTGVLFGAACEVGAIAAEAEEETRRACYTFGVTVGRAYQMADDLTDIHRFIGSRILTPENLISLGPAIARFVPGSSGLIRTFLDRETFSFTENVATLLRKVKVSLENAIEETLESATRSLREALPADPSNDLLYAVPSVIVEAFMSSEVSKAAKA